MLREMTSQQFLEWIAYYQIEPWGTLTEDLEWAHWKALYVNGHLKKGKRPYKTEKFKLFAEKSKDATDLFEAEGEEDQWQETSTSQH